MSVDGLVYDVSIHARHYWRASQARGFTTSEHIRCFNPRPPLLASEPVGVVDVGGLHLVSIHARHYWRASPPAIESAGLRYQFQSTPAITGERAGRPPSDCAARRCFNPRPPLLASEPPVAGRARVVVEVSIHARHYWRASRKWATASPSPALFQSTPAITGERALGPNASRSRLQAFQSTPAITGERAELIQQVVATGEVSFNPRPPLLASEPILPMPSDFAPMVSIHARHYWRASHVVLDGSNCSDVFQSTPAITGERAGQRVVVGGLDGGVSIHARHYWRASRG